MSEFKSECTRILSKLRPSTTFLTIHHYMNNFGEVADHSVCFHVNYLNAVKRAKKLLESFRPLPKNVIGKKYDFDHLKAAREELIESYSMTLSGFNPLATSSSSYDEIENDQGETIPGIKLHREQDSIHLWGFQLHKRIIFLGKYPPDRRACKTIVKDELRSLTPLGKFAQYKLVPNRFNKIVVDGMTIKDYDVVKESESSIAIFS